MAESGTTDELNVCVPGLVNEIVWLDCPAAVSVNDCCAFGPAPLLAVNVMTYGPPTGGFPESTPVVVLNAKVPPGRAELEYVIGASPAAVTVNELGPIVEKVALEALVKTGAALRVSVKLAVSGASVGTKVAPHVLSAANEACTAALDTEAKLMTYGPAVALLCGAKLNVARSWFAAGPTGAELVAPKSATSAGLLIANGTVETSLLGSL